MFSRAETFYIYVAITKKKLIRLCVFLLVLILIYDTITITYYFVRVYLKSNLTGIQLHIFSTTP